MLSFMGSALPFITPWWKREQSARYSGLWEERLVPSEQYDCVVVLPHATPPLYTD